MGHEMNQIEIRFGCPKERTLCVENQGRERDDVKAMGMSWTKFLHFSVEIWCIDFRKKRKEKILLMIFSVEINILLLFFLL